MKILGLNTGINRTKSYPTSNKPYNLSFHGIDDKFIKDLSATTIQAQQQTAL